MQNRWVVCDTHNIMNAFKLTESNMAENIKAKDGKSEFEAFFDPIEFRSNLILIQLYSNPAIIMGYKNSS